MVSKKSFPWFVLHIGPLVMSNFGYFLQKEALSISFSSTFISLNVRLGQNFGVLSPLKRIFHLFWLTALLLAIYLLLGYQCQRLLSILVCVHEEAPLCVYNQGVGARFLSFLIKDDALFTLHAVLSTSRKLKLALLYLCLVPPLIHGAAVAEELPSCSTTTVM